MRYTFKPKGRRVWRGRYRLQDEKNITDISLDTWDRQVAEERLRKIVNEKDREKEGMIAPGSIRNAAQRKLVDHLDDYIADLEKAKRSNDYIYHVEKRVKRLIAECPWPHCTDITPDSFQNWRTQQHGKSAKTLNDFLNAASSFCNWMMRQARTSANPLKYVSHVQVRGNETVRRRAFTDDEMRRLLAVAGSHKIVYLTAVCTGLRRSELAALKWGDIDLDTDAPVIKVRASTTKNRRAALLPLQDGLADELRRYRPASWAADDFAFAAGIPSMKIYKKDLRTADILFMDAQGKRADFHALRHTYCTNLARAGVSPWLAMKLMRHSDINLTTRVYTDAGKLPSREAVGRLPDFFPMIGKKCDVSRQRSRESGFTGQAVSRMVTDGEEDELRETIDSIDESHYLALAGATGQKPKMAERGGFEPPVPVYPVRRFSKPLLSATQPPLHFVTSCLRGGHFRLRPSGYAGQAATSPQTNAECIPTSRRVGKNA